MRKTLLTAAILISSFLLLAACGSDDTSSSGENQHNLFEKLKEEGKVTVGFADENPYAYQDENGELKGAAVDIAKAVFKKMGINEMEGKLADFKQLIPGLNAGKFDVITAGMAITPDRCENAAFGEPEMMYGEGLVVKKGNPKNIHSYKDIAGNTGIKVSVMSGATENGFLESEGVDPEQIQNAPDIPATFSAVESGRADVTTATDATLKTALDSYDSDELEYVLDFNQPDIDGVPSYGAAAFNKANDELRKAYNEALAELKSEGKIAELIEPYGFTEELNIVPETVTTEKICSGEIK